MKSCCSCVCDLLRSLTMAAFKVDTGLLTIGEVSRVSGAQREPDDLQATAQDAMQHLFGEVLALPRKVMVSRGGGSHPVYEMPLADMKLPREKSAPREKLETAWDKFAKKKGIRKTKKGNRVFDEDRQEWVDRWGKRASEVKRQKEWVKEVKSNYAPTHDGADPFFDEAQAKKKTLAKAKKGAEKNRRRSEYAAQASAEANRLSKTISSLATASMGKFDKSSAGKKSKRK